MICPDWQYPHCGTSSVTQAFCSGCEEFGERPSMVTICAPSAAETCTWQERCARPSMCTVQAPQNPAPQPYFVPVSPTMSRITQSRGVLGSASTETGLPFTENEAIGDLPEVSHSRRALFHLPAQASPRVSIGQRFEIQKCET